MLFKENTRLDHTNNEILKRSRSHSSFDLNRRYVQYFQQKLKKIDLVSVFWVRKDSTRIPYSI